MGRLVLLLLVTTLAGAGDLAGGATHGKRIGVAGVSIALPQNWHSIRQSAHSQSEPATRIVASSGSIRFGRGCNQLDYSFPPTAVAIVVVEWVRPTPGARFAPRPRRFTARTLRVVPPPAIECFDGPGGSAQFSAGGRRFAAYVLLGRRAPPSLATRARAMLDTLTVRRRA